MNTDYQKTMRILLHKESLNGMILVSTTIYPYHTIILNISEAQSTTKETCQNSPCNDPSFTPGEGEGTYFQLQTRRHHQVQLHPLQVE
jgi:hypothetical protein